MKNNPIELTIIKKNAKTVTFKVKNEDRELSRFTASNGISINCVSNPQYDAYRKILYTQGSTRSWDDIEITVSNATFKKIRAAVDEYNEKFGEKPMPKPVEKLSLKIKIVPTNSNSEVVAFKIVEQSGFGYCARHKFEQIEFISVYSPNFYSDTMELCIRGIDKSKDDNIICVTTDEFVKIESAIKLLNESSPKFIEKITFLYTNDGVKTRRCLNVVKKSPDSYEGIDEDKSEYRKFLRSKMSKIEVIK